MAKKVRDEYLKATLPKSIILKIFLFLFALAIIVYLFLTFTKPGRTIVTISYFFRSALQSENSISKTGYKKPDFDTIRYPTSQTTTEAWLFKPKNSLSHSAIIISPGVGINEDNKVLIMRASDYLRNAGITVLVPFSDDLKNNLITPISLESYKNGFLYLENLKGIDKQKIGFFGFCVGSDIAMLTAADPQIRNDVAFIVAFASYADLNDYYSQALSTQTIGRIQRRWFPNIITYNILLKNMFYRLDNQNDTQILTDYYLNRINNSQNLTNLTPEGKQIKSFIESKDAYYIKENFPKASERIRSDLAAFTPVNYVSQIKAPLFIIHDKNDNFEPVEESRRLKQAFGNKATYLETTILDHTVLKDNLPPTVWIGQGAQIIAFLFKVFQKTS